MRLEYWFEEDEKFEYEITDEEVAECMEKFFDKLYKQTLIEILLEELTDKQVKDSFEDVLLEYFEDDARSFYKENK